MESKLIDAICSQVYRKFPEVAGAQPSISSRPNDETLLVFKGSVKTENGHSMPRAVRVVANASGKILKMTTSR